VGGHFAGLALVIFPRPGANFLARVFTIPF
jgi:hypothetical protein